MPAKPYTPAEILAIFQEQHRLCSPLDPEAETSYPLRPETTIRDWREAQDLLPWEELGAFLSSEFQIEVGLEEWKLVLEPEKHRRLWDVCVFIADRAERLSFSPVKLFGRECLEAGIFMGLKDAMGQRGASVEALRPSTPISEFLWPDAHFSPFVEAVTLTGLRVIDAFDFGDSPWVRSKTCWIDKIYSRWVSKRSLFVRDMVTFRDLVERMAFQYR